MMTGRCRWTFGGRRRTAATLLLLAIASADPPCRPAAAAAETRPIDAAPLAFSSRCRLAASSTVDFGDVRRRRRRFAKTIVDVIPRGGARAAAVAASSSEHDDKSGNRGEGGKAKKRRKTRRAKARGSDGDETSAEPTKENAENDKVEARKAINTAMRGTDPADALGDAIRERADVLRGDDDSSAPPSTTRDPAVRRIDASLASLGRALGTSDPTTVAAARRAADEEDRTAAANEGGGVQASPGAVVANYFLKSHGGSHGVQCVASLLASVAGIGALLVPPPSLTPMSSDGTGTGASVASALATQSRPAKLVLLRRALLCALAKHAGGLLAAVALSARRIPEAGLRDTRRQIEALALDPVSQYLFYCALLLVWLPTSLRVAEAAPATEGTAATAAVVVPWWLRGGKGGVPGAAFMTSVLLLPVLLREVVSTAWVISDVLVLLGSSSASGKAHPFLGVARDIVDAAMSLLFTPSRWRDTDAAGRQRLLATLVSRASLGFEVVVGVVVLYDALRAFGDFALSPVHLRPPLLAVGKRIACARLYVNFMLVRRKKIRDLVGSIRGGAVVERVLDALLEPKKAMGVFGADESGNVERFKGSEAEKGKGWTQIAATALGFEE